MNGFYEEDFRNCFNLAKLLPFPGETTTGAFGSIFFVLFCFVLGGRVGKNLLSTGGKKEKYKFTAKECEVMPLFPEMNGERLWIHRQCVRKYFSAHLCFHSVIPCFKKEIVLHEHWAYDTPENL